MRVKLPLQIFSRKVKDYGRDLILLRNCFIQGSGGFGGQELRLFQQSSPVRWWGFLAEDILLCTMASVGVSHHFLII